MIALPLLLALALETPSFDYDRSRPLAIQNEPDHPDGAESISFANAAGGRTSAFLVRPATGRKGPGVLFVHWYEPESKDSNRTQFLDQARELARSGATCLLIDTMWSKPDWFPTRKREDDYANSIQQVKEIRRALGVLLAQERKGSRARRQTKEELGGLGRAERGSLPVSGFARVPQWTVDPARIAYVGHDFGAMYGAVLAGVDRRVRVWALQAGTTSFSSWFLLGTKLQGPERQAVIDRLAPLDPLLYIGKAAPSPILFQFGRHDPYVPEPQARDFVNRANEPKTVLWYDAGHGLNEQAIRDRQAWLKKQLGIE